MLFHCLLVLSVCVLQVLSTNETTTEFLNPVENRVEEVDGIKFLAKLCNATLAVFISLLLVYPIDLVKVRLQNQVVDDDGNYEYNGLFDCLKKIVVTEGFFSLYSGLLIFLVLIMPEKAVQYASNDLLRYQLSQVQVVDGYLPYYFGALAGVVASFFQVLITSWMELLKIRMQEKGTQMIKLELDEAKELDKTGPCQMAKKIIKEEGGFFRGFYRGFWCTFVREALFNAYYFPMIDLVVFRYGFVDSSGEPPIWYTFIVAIFLGGLGSWIMTPIDVVKSRMQGWDFYKYKNSCDCIRIVWREGKLRSFYKGSVCRVAFVSLLYGFLQAIYFLKVAERAMGIHAKGLQLDFD